MTQLFRLYIDKFLVFYFDDILIYRKTRVDHVEHLWVVLRTLRLDIFFINLKKCTFMSSHVVFLVFFFSSKGVKSNPEKVRTILNWPIHNNILEV